LSGIIFLSGIINYQNNVGLHWIFQFLRIFYFIAIIIFISQYVEKYGDKHIVSGFLIGCAIVVYQKFMPISDLRLISGIPIINDPNVVGGIIVMASLFCFLNIARGYNLYLVPLALFMIMSLTTYSKGAWLMIACVNMMCFGTYIYSERNKIVNAKYEIITIFIVMLFLTTCIYQWLKIDFCNFDLVDMLSHKVTTTQNNQSVQIRTELVKKSFEILINNPAFGIGWGNFNANINTIGKGVIQYDNAHNVFAQLIATAGVQSLLVFIYILALSVYEFKIFVLKLYNSKFVGYSIMFCYTFIIFIYGSVQLQIFVQSSFWLFCAVIIGLNKNRSHIFNIK